MNNQLTGRQRYRARSRLFAPAVLILQVEENVMLLENYGSHIESRSATIWRDATVEDFVTVTTTFLESYRANQN